MRKLMIIGVVAAASAASAQPRYTRKQPTVIAVTQSARVKPVKPIKAEPAKPITADTVLLIRDRQQPLRREQQAILEQLVKDTPDDDPDKADLLFRLAEQYAQQLQFWRLKSVESAIRR